MTELFNNLKAKVADHQSRDVVNTLLFLLEKDSPLHNDLLVIKGRLHELDQSIRRGTIGTEDSTVEKNKIKSSLIEFIDRVKASYFIPPVIITPEESPNTETDRVETVEDPDTDVHPTRRWQLFAAIIFSILMLAVGKFWGESAAATGDATLDPSPLVIDTADVSPKAQAKIDNLELLLKERDVTIDDQADLIKNKGFSNSRYQAKLNEKDRTIVDLRNDLQQAQQEKEDLLKNQTASTPSNPPPPVFSPPSGSRVIIWCKTDTWNSDIVQTMKKKLEQKKIAVIHQGNVSPSDKISTIEHMTKGGRTTRALARHILEVLDLTYCIKTSSTINKLTDIRLYVD